MLCCAPRAVPQVLASRSLLHALWQAMSGAGWAALRLAVQLLALCVTAEEPDCTHEGRSLGACALSSLLGAGGGDALAAAMRSVAEAVGRQQAQPGYAEESHRLSAERIGLRQVLGTPEVVGCRLLACVHASAAADAKLHFVTAAKDGSSSLARTIKTAVTSGSWQEIDSTAELLPLILEDASLAPWPPKLMHAHLQLFLQVSRSTLKCSRVCTSRTQVFLHACTHRCSRLQACAHADRCVQLCAWISWQLCCTCDPWCICYCRCPNQNR